MNESVEYKSFDFIRKLINAERYKYYKKDEWGGCDLIIVSNLQYKNRKDSYDKWEEEGCHKLIHHDNANSIIWLIETLKPYVNYDYLSKYEYYSNIADLILLLQKTVNDEKQLLLSIVQYLEDKKYDKNLVESYLERNTLMTWYNFGIEHNDPFFVKFVALWMAFNEKYFAYYKEQLKTSENKEYHESETIMNYCYKNRSVFESVHDKVFNSEFIQIFKDKPVKDMKSNFDGSTTHKSLLEKTGIAQTQALLKTIYRVRCNLLHGSKSPEIARDIELVRCSGEIMEIYMNAIMLA